MLLVSCNDIKVANPNPQEVDLHLSPFLGLYSEFFNGKKTKVPYKCGHIQGKWTDKH